MADWVLVPCLVQLRTEFNKIAPGRDKASDGSIGDTAHQSSVSDHNADEVGNVPITDADKSNEVHAIDVDKDLKNPRIKYNGYTGLEAVVQFLLARCRSGKEKRLRYIIYNGRIWRASNGWAQEAYKGSNPHGEHAHFSASYTSSHEADTSTWHLEDTVATLDDDDLDKIEARIWNHLEENPLNPKVKGRVGGWVRMAEYHAKNRHAEVLAALNKFVVGETARDVEAAARDAAMMTLIQQITKAVSEQTGSKVFTDAQFNELKQLLAEKVTEAGADAAQRAEQKLNQMAEALDNAGEALATANDEQPTQ
jgi:hypothetical protein